MLAIDTFTLTIARLMVGFCAGIFPSALMAYAFDAEGKIGRFTAFGSLGFGSGVLIAGTIGAYDLIFLASALLMTVAFLISLLLPFQKEVRRKVPLFPVEIMRRNLPAYAAILLRHTGANMVWVTFPIFLEDLGAEPFSIGVIYAVNSITQFTAMQFLDRFNPSRLVLVGILASAIVFVLFTQANSFWEVLPMEVLLATAWSCLYVGSVNYVMRRNIERGTSAGLLQSTISVSAIMGSLIGGMVSFTYGYHGSMLMAVGMALLAAIVFLWGDKRAAQRFGKGYMSGE
jgi:MFS family permease